MADNNALTALISAGADAMSNMYDVTLEFADWNATVRAEGFKIPEVSVDTYDVTYHGISYKRVKTEQKFERSFDLTFRLDAKYGLYDAFTSVLAWHVNPNTGGVSNANIDKVGTVTVKTVDAAMTAAEENLSSQLSGSPLGLESYSSSESQSIGQITSGKTWKFYNCCVTSVAQPDFKTDSGGSMTFQVTFIFGDVDYPGFDASQSA